MPFGYFGSKRRLASTYPAARHDTIIEPFAGAAGYSLQGDHWTRNVILYDINPEVINVWRYLQAATEQQITDLPDIVAGQPYPVPHDHPAYSMMRWATGGTSNKNTVGGWPPKRWTPLRLYVASQLHKIRHWQIIEGDYTDAPDIEATWFIDPPYQHQGHRYAFGSTDINYSTLGKWAKSRIGQAIVCEQEPADWLPFGHHASVRTQIRDNPLVSELIWTNEPALRLFGQGEANG